MTTKLLRVSKLNKTELYSDMLCFKSTKKWSYLRLFSIFIVERFLKNSCVHLKLLLDLLLNNIYFTSAHFVF